MDNYFGLDKKLGFGCMRLPYKGEDIDYEQVSAMFDYFLKEGFRYFDTAHGYLGGLSEVAVRKCLTSRYPRDAYILTDKLSDNHFYSNGDIRPLLETKLKACGADYFDFYLMHAQNGGNYQKYVDLGAYEMAKQFKAEGKIRHIGISFHDSPQFLEKILTEHPEIEVVQIQFNYLDFYDRGVQSKNVYDVARKFNKPIIVMEPVKGGKLANLPPEANDVFLSLGTASPASYAIRFAASFEGVFMVLSGMSSLDMVKDNTSFMKEFKPLSAAELEAVGKVRSILSQENLIPCTSCHYCTEVCPRHIPIPDIFTCLNNSRQFGGEGPKENYLELVENGSSAGDCLHCGACEKRCPQKIGIRGLLEKAAEEYGK